MKEKKGPDEDPLGEAKQYIQLLTRYRPRTRKEVEDRLGEKDFSPEIISSAVGWARRHDLVNDEAFAKLWIDDRLQRKPKGRNALYKELLDHGVEKAVAEDVLDQKLSDVKSAELCRELAEQRLKRYRGDQVKAKYRKTANFLTRRGFRKGLVHRILRDLLFGDE
ncbi:MAG: regulatory protein RecX [Candidatus Acetothermia bacterium]